MGYEVPRLEPGYLTVDSREHGTTLVSAGWGQVGWRAGGAT